MSETLTNLQSDSINELATALAKAQGKIGNAVKDSANPYFKSKYADLTSVREACQEHLSAAGIAVIQSPTFIDGAQYLCTTLAHSSGQWMRGFYPINPVKNDPQGVGSAITYARRYALAAMTGVAPEDDDGNAASARSEVKPKKDKVFSQWMNNIIGDMSNAENLDDLAKIYRLAFKHGKEAGYEDDQLDLLTVQKDNRKMFLQSQIQQSDDLEEGFKNAMDKE